MQKKVKWEEMFPDEIMTAIEKRPVCYLGYGFAEPHGLPNALGLDGFKARGILEHTAKKYGGVVAPMTWWHVHENTIGQLWLKDGNIGDRTFLTNVPLRLFLETALSQLRAVENAGFRVAILVSGHFGGLEMDLRRVAHVYSQHRPLRAYALGDWELIRDKNYTGGHAGYGETSQLWAVNPELVDMSRMQKKRIDKWVFAGPENTRNSSRRAGVKFIDRQAYFLNKTAGILLKNSRKYPQGKWLSFKSAEIIWKKIESQKNDWVWEAKTFDELSKRNDKALLTLAKIKF